MTQTYRIRSADTWAQARDDYLFGHSAEQVCRRYDLSLRTFRRRAREEGWRRIDHADPEPRDDGEEDLHLFDDYDVRELARIARLRMAAAIVRGDALEATRWRRMWSALQAEIVDQAETACDTAEVTPPALDIETDPPARSPHVEAALTSLAENHPEWRHWHGENEWAAGAPRTPVPAHPGESRAPVLSSLAAAGRDAGILSA